MKRDLSAPCSENKALNADDIADIPLFEVGKGILTYIVHSDIDLDPAARIKKVDEVCLAHIAPAHHSSRDPDGHTGFLEGGFQRLGVISALCRDLALRLFIILFCLRAACADIKLSDLKRVFARCLKLAQLIHPDLLVTAYFLVRKLRFLGEEIVFFIHFLHCSLSCNLYDLELQNTHRRINVENIADSLMQNSPAYR